MPFQVGFLSSLIIVNERVVVNEGLSLKIINEGSSLTIVNEGSSLTIRSFQKKNIFKKLTFKIKDRFPKKNKTLTSLHVSN